MGNVGDSMHEVAACGHRVDGEVGGADTYIGRLLVARLQDVLVGLAAVRAAEGTGSLLSLVNVDTVGGREAADGVHTVVDGVDHEVPWPDCTDHLAIEAEMQVVD